VCTGAYTDLSTELALSIGNEFDPSRVGAAELSDLALDFRLNPRAFERERARLASSVPSEAVKLAAQAQAEGWHRPILETIVELIRKRATQL
jgi:hypothetical protein